MELFCSSSVPIGGHRQLSRSLHLSEIREDGIHVTQFKSSGKVEIRPPTAPDQPPELIGVLGIPIQNVRRWFARTAQEHGYERPTNGNNGSHPRREVTKRMQASSMTWKCFITASGVTRR